ncbi:unnamed protein product [Larinioides sclopetarius]|uniref:Transmembrane protein 267 n=1 Tax=Larinioides sclopetarius TaxID=280406 RepID=A0AAV1ZTS5_9ARAC
MTLIFCIKQASYIICLLILSHYSDFILNLEVVYKNISLRCITDNLTHVCLGIISWLIVCSYDSFSTTHFYQSLLCGLFAGLIDLDHFLMAKSLKFKDAISLSSRPPFHNTTFVSMFAISLILVMHFKGNETFENIAVKEYTHTYYPIFIPVELNRPSMNSTEIFTIFATYFLQSAIYPR